MKGAKRTMESIPPHIPSERGLKPLSYKSCLLAAWLWFSNITLNIRNLKREQIQAGKCMKEPLLFQLERQPTPPNILHDKTLMIQDLIRITSKASRRSTLDMFLTNTHCFVNGPKLQSHIITRHNHNHGSSFTFPRSSARNLKIGREISRSTNLQLA